MNEDGGSLVDMGWRGGGERMGLEQTEIEVEVTGSGWRVG